MRHNSGFTLAEVLVALAILGTVMFVLIGTHQSALRLQIQAEDTIEERQLLENAVSRAEIGIMSGTLSGSGDFGARYTDCSWSYDAQNVSQDGMVPLYQVTARLTMPSGEKSLDFFYFDTGADSSSTSDASLSGKSNVKRGAGTSSMSGTSNTNRTGSGSSFSRGGGFGSSRSTSSRGGF